MISPAESHEYLNLELSRAWEPLESLGTAGYYPTERSEVGFLM